MPDELGTTAFDDRPDAGTSRRERPGDNRRRWWRRPILATTVLVAALVGWQIFGGWHANSVISSEVLTAIENDQPSSIVVTLSVDPERFHSEYVRERGSVALVDGRQFFMRAVAPDEIQRIGSEYWIVDVDAWEES